ncbi:B3 DNA binding domain [Dillenia turbinata]|uniref:B3 DNA binding domain n=1 Tax=Dillenia turbinata TaxID=194707 RepID=A0AAN8YXA1_9MAGN
MRNLYFFVCFTLSLSNVVLSSCCLSSNGSLSFCHEIHDIGRLTLVESERANAKPYVKFEQVDSDNNAGTSIRFNQEAACVGNSNKLLEEKQSFALGSPEDRAHEFQANLSENGPSIVRTMPHSTVTAGYWLNFPAEFSRRYMPRRDASFMLEAEDQVAYITRYKVAQRGLSAGWRTFAKEHDLKEGDALVFHLVRPHKFKEEERTEYG